uniref:Caspase-6 n=1 Tax=Sphaeramia orbicularis TaxID=375764 RepID=A0A672YQQ8_9TELE
MSENSNVNTLTSDIPLHLHSPRLGFLCVFSVLCRYLHLDPAEEYKMNHKRRGLALIFNQENFGSTSRAGSRNDRDKLLMRLTEMKFDVKVYDNMNEEEVYKSISEAAEADHSDADCFLLVFLSHGDKDHVDTYDGQISIEDITSPFKGDKCRTLVGKPKIFIFQACRGDKNDDPATACDAVDSVVEEPTGDGARYTLPAGADFIMCYSVAEGYFSNRNIASGSWYIQALCELFEKYGDSLEFTELLTLVNRKVSVRSVQCGDSQKDGKKQVPYFASMLTKKLYFRPKK